MTDRTIAGVLFDLDNTLIDRDLAFLGWARWFVAEQMLVADGAVAAQEIEWLVGLDYQHGPNRPLFAAVATRFSELVSDVNTFADEFPTRLREHIPPLDEPTLALLAELEIGEVPWGIVTNGSPTQLKKIERMGLDRAACVVVSGIFGARKPERAIFHAAAAALGVAPEQILFVGDNVEADIVGAANAGMVTAWMRRGRDWPDNDAGIVPDYIIDHTAEIRPVIQKIASR
jgi:putative hydrolase of the HAD superfamily